MRNHSIKNDLVQNSYYPPPPIKIAIALALFSAAGLFAQTKLPSFYIDLQNYPLYLKEGFSAPDTETPDFADGSWKTLENWTHVIISNLGLPGSPKRAFLSPLGRPVQEWTFAIPFTHTGETPVMPGLFLAGIGENWEIYLNGILIRKEMYFVEHGGVVKIAEHHSEREVFFPFERHLLRQGKNLLVFRIAGDPTDQTLGFQYARSYYLADYEYIARKNSEAIRMILAGAYVLIGLYYLLIFAFHPQERYNIYCGSFSVGMGLYYLTRTHGIYEFIPDTLAVVRLEFFFIFLMIPVLMAFTEQLCRGRLSLVTKIYSACIGFLALSQLVLPHSYGSDALIIWQIIGIAAILWIFIHNILLPFITAINEGRKFRSALWNTPSGNLLISMGIIISSIIFDLLDALLLHYSIGTTRYSMLIFVIGVAAMMARLYAKTQRELADALLANSKDRLAARERIFREHDLTERETEIAAFMVQGLDSAKIAERLFISESAVAFHITNIYRKFGIDGKRNGRSSFLALFMK